MVELEDEEDGGEGEGGEREPPPALERKVKSLAVSKVGCDGCMVNQFPDVIPSAHTRHPFLTYGRSPPAC